MVLSGLGITEQSPRHLRLSQTALAVDAAISGQGVALVNRFLAARDIEAGKLAEISPLPTVSTQDFYLLCKRKPAPSPQVQAIMSWLISQASQV